MRFKEASPNLLCTHILLFVTRDGKDTILLLIILVCLTALSISNMLVFLCNAFVFWTEYELTCKFVMLVIEKILIFLNKLFFQTLILPLKFRVCTYEFKLSSEVIVKCFVTIYAFLIVAYWEYANFFWLIFSLVNHSDLSICYWSVLSAWFYCCLLLHHFSLYAMHTSFVYPWFCWTSIINVTGKQPPALLSDFYPCCPCAACPYSNHFIFCYIRNYDYVFYYNDPIRI